MIAYKGDNYKITLRKTITPLPFTIKLNDFEKFSYPGTELASEYQSYVTIIEEDGLEWSQQIRMNEPLRTHGYTLYQSSFVTLADKQFSVLAVVKNSGYLFPYIASILMALGLFFQCLKRFRASKENA